MTKKTKVFISYAREDASTAKRLYLDLQESEIEPWLDDRSLLPGQPWKSAISAAIRDSDFFLALLSHQSISKKGYVQKELREALEILDQTPHGDIYVVPIRLETCEPRYGKLRELNWLDLFPDYNDALGRLIKVIGQFEVATPKPRNRVLLNDIAVTDRSDLGQSGWGVVFPPGYDPAIRRALAPLLDLRCEEAGSLYLEMNYTEGEGIDDFLERHAFTPGGDGPARLPLYLLLVGSPMVLPFSFQWDLSLLCSVGRLDLPTADDYARYAENVLAAQRSPVKNQAFVFGTNHPGDRGSQLMMDFLVKPIEAVLNTQSDKPAESALGAQATRKRLVEELCTDARYALWFIVAHGLQTSDDHRHDWQGAIICSDWPGEGGIDREHLFGPSDLPSNTALTGAVVLHFGAYSAGSTRRETYVPPSHQQLLGEHDHVSLLAKRLLSLQNGPLAMIAHVNRPWTFSFNSQMRSLEGYPVEAAVRRILKGERAGIAFEPFTDRYKMVAARLSNSLLDESLESPPSIFIDDLREQSQDERTRIRLRVAAQDAREFVLLGDPAAQARFD